MRSSNLAYLLFALLALDMSGAARDLVRKVAAALAHEPATLSVRNLSSLGPAETAEIRRAFESELRPGGSAEVRLTISENLTAFLLVAEVRRAGDRQVLIESWPRATSAISGASRAPRIILQRTLLFDEDQPILDAIEANGALAVLDRAGVTVIRGADRQSVALTPVHPLPRDLRGRLAANGAAFTAWLPGAVCHVNLTPQPASVCEESTQPLPLAAGATAPLAPARNFFQGVVAMDGWGARDVPAFYSAARAGDWWIFASLDGRARVYSRAWEPVATVESWGSDVAGVNTPCGPRILATRPGGGDAPDAIRPYELIAGAPNPAGPALDFNGPITALWSNGVSATVVARDLETGHYAAYSLVPVCGS